jgi:hypothetical protein
MVVEATADDAGAEVIELPKNRFFMLSLFQPQIGALAGKPVHPLLREFVHCAREHADGVGLARDCGRVLHASDRPGCVSSNGAER